MAKMDWKDKISHHSQVGGIETSVLDNGLGRGCRIAWVHTGSPLRYKILIDRGLDILDAFYGAHSLAWISHSGAVAPVMCSDRQIEWLWTFGGGLLTTCGLTHIGGPEEDEYGVRGVHGRFSNLPAEIERIDQPDPANGKLDFAIAAVVRETRVFGQHLFLRRVISGRLGEPAIYISDRVVNAGNQPCPLMLLYHINFGWPLVDAGADIVYRGQFRSRGLPMDDATFAAGDVKQCKAPQAAHRGGGEGCGFIDPAAQRDGNCKAAIVNKKLPLAAVVEFNKKQLPCLANWQHWGPGEYVCALEPGTNFPIGQKKARLEKSLQFLKPGQSKQFDVAIRVLDSKQQISDFVSKWG